MISLGEAKAIGYIFESPCFKIYCLNYLTLLDSL